MIYLICGLIIIVFVMIDIIQTTLTTKGEGLISGFVSEMFRKISSSFIRKGHRPSEVMGATAIFALGSVWLVGLWAGWILVFIGIPDSIAYAGDRSGIDIYDIIYFVGFTLSTLGIGDLSPRGPVAQIATALSSFTGLLIVTLIVTYAVSVVSAVVARRVLAYKIYLVGGDEGEFLTEFSSEKDFASWVGSIKNELISSTEQRLAYPILDNFVSKDERFSLPVQLSRLGLASHRETHNDGASPQSKKALYEMLSVLERYTALAGITEDDIAIRLEKLGKL